MPRRDAGDSTGAAVTERPSFALERFAWAAPDRLELVGTFSALPRNPAGAVWLVVRGANGEHRLPVVAGNAQGAPTNGRWTATFAWQEPPVAFDTAQLQFESGIRVDLPEPGPKRLLRRTILEVQYPDAADDQPAPGTARASDGAAPAPPAVANGDRPEPDAGEEPLGRTTTEPDSPVSAAQRIGLEAELLGAQEAARDAAAAAERARAELARAQEDLAGERERRTADAQRFTTTLESYRSSAEETVAAEQAAARQLARDLEQAADAQRAREQELEDLRAELAGIHAARDELGAELEALREHAASFAETEARTEALQEELTQAREQAEAADRATTALRASLEAAEEQARLADADRSAQKQALEQARADAERLLERLTTATAQDPDGR